MSRIRRPTGRPARFIVAWSVYLLAIVGLTRGVGFANAPASSAWAPASSTSSPTTGPIGTVARDAWRADWLVRCVVPVDAGEHAAAAPSREVRELLELVDYVRREPDLGVALLAAGWDQRVAICLDDRPEGLLGAYDLDHGLVVLNERLSLRERAVILVHELRHVEATARGFRTSLAYAMPDIVRLHLALEADAQAVATLYAWKATELGDPGLWSALCRLDRHADVALAFERNVVATGSTWQATRAAFTRWYASSERANAYLRDAYLAYLDALDASKTVPSYEPLPPGALDGLGRLPSGRDYRPRLPASDLPSGRGGAGHGSSATFSRGP